MDNVPQHVSIIMDGNGRWAKARGKERVYGHMEGVESVRACTEAAVEAGVKYLSLYAFSEENWNRPEAEVNRLMELMMEAIHGEVKTLLDNDVRFVVLGNRARLSDKLNAAIDALMEKTAACARMIDGSEFVGDLVIPGAETGVGSMLFRRAKSWVLAVWTQDEGVGAGREVKIPVVPDAVFGMMGDARKVDAKDGAVTIRASADVMYLVGKGSVPASLLRLVDKSGELSETRWNNRIDGNEPKFTVGRDPNPVSLSYGPAGERPSVAAWHDAEALRFRVDLPAACAVGGNGKLFLYFSTRPDRQPQIGDWAYFDYELKASLKDGAFTLTLGNPTFPKNILNLAADAPTEGITWSSEEKNGARRLEVSIPVRLLNGFGANKKGLMSGQVSWATEGKSWKLNSKTPEQNWQWPLWKLE